MAHGCIASSRTDVPITQPFQRMAILELRAAGRQDPNPVVWKALLNMTREGKFLGQTVPCFFDSSETQYGILRKAVDIQYAVYDPMPNAMDWFGMWNDDPARLNPDCCITADGRSGIVV